MRSPLLRAARTAGIATVLAILGVPAAAQDGVWPGEPVSATGAAVPGIAVRVPKEAVRLGTRTLVLNDAVEAEIHVFAEADAHGLVARFYWVQFERFLSEANGRYPYRTTNPETIRLDGIEMHVLPGGENTTLPLVDPGEDYVAFRDIVNEAGLRLPTWLTTLRLIHLPDPDERSEVMIVYGEGPDALAQAAAEAMMAGATGLEFADLLSQLIADVDARVDILSRR